MVKKKISALLISSKMTYSYNTKKKKINNSGRNDLYYH